MILNMKKTCTISQNIPRFWFNWFWINLFYTDMFNVYIFNSIYTWITIVTVIWVKSASLLSITCALNSSFWHCRSTFEIVIASIPTMLFWWASVEGFNDPDNFTIFAGDVSPSFVFTKYVAMDYWCRTYNTS